MEMQDKILETLQKDNEHLINEKKVLSSRVTTLENELANLEAKHSLLLSAKENSAPPPAQNSTAVSQLQATIKELQFALDESETMSKKLKQKLEKFEHHQQALDDAEAEIRSLRVDLKRKESEFKDVVEGLSAKISSFIDSEDYNKVQEEIIKEHENTIRDLRSQLNEGGRKDQQNKNVSSNKDRQIRNLSKRIAELEETLQKKNPDNIAELIRSCQPDVHNSQLFKKEERRVKQLEQALLEKDKGTEAALGRLKEEMEKLRRQYEDRIASLQAELFDARNSQQRISPKLKELEKENLTLRRQAMNDLSPGTPPPAVSNVENELHELRTENNTLHKRIVELEMNVALRNQNASLMKQMQERLDSLSQEADFYKKMSNDKESSIKDIQERCEEKIRLAKENFTSQLLNYRKEHNNELDRLQRSHQAEIRRIANQNNTSGSDDLSQSLMQIAKEGGNSAFLHSVLDKLKYLEKRCIQKEKEAAFELTEARRIAELERTLLEQKADLIIEQKNQQINEFRSQLDQLIVAMASLQPNGGKS
ncbi:viral A-type inclusion protein [Strigomonas culicis]|uniref:Centrosomal protein of 162 kDa n=1 Tax=Strigomonas culicis TaxID=28005 RepID=S9U3W7_9TRYP|nr:viral A-type inclusion protein [Strigomonas culicis]|eukprot:EPY23499.1 viral A-type inclusion protein [Strigomonas culicis]